MTNSERTSGSVHDPSTLRYPSTLSLLGNSIFLMLRYPILLALAVLAALTFHISFFAVFYLAGFMLVAYAWGTHVLLRKGCCTLNDLLIEGWRGHWRLVLWYLLGFITLMAYGVIVETFLSNSEIFDLYLRVPVPVGSLTWLLLIFVHTLYVTGRPTEKRGRRFYYVLFQRAMRYIPLMVAFIFLANVLPFFVKYVVLSKQLDTVPTLQQWIEGSPEVHRFFNPETWHHVGNLHLYLKWLVPFAIVTVLSAEIQKYTSRDEAVGTRLSPMVEQLNLSRARRWFMSIGFVLICLLFALFSYLHSTAREMTTSPKLLAKYSVDAMTYNMPIPKPMGIVHFEDQDNVLFTNGKKICRLRLSGWAGKCQRLWHDSDRIGIEYAQFLPRSQRFVIGMSQLNSDSKMTDYVYQMYSLIDGKLLFSTYIPNGYKFPFGYACTTNGEFLAIERLHSDSSTKVRVGSMERWSESREIAVANNLQRLIMSPDGQQLAVISKDAAEIIQWQQGNSRQAIPQLVEGSAMETVQDVDFSHDGQFTILLYESQMVVINTADGTEQYRTNFAELMKTPQLSYVKLTDHNEYITVVGQGQWPKSVSNVPDWSLSVNQLAVIVVHLPTGKVVGHVAGHAEGLHTVDYLPEKEYVVISGRFAPRTNFFFAASYESESTGTHLYDSRIRK